MYINSGQRIVGSTNSTHSQGRLLRQSDKEYACHYLSMTINTTKQEGGANDNLIDEVTAPIDII